MSGIVGILNTDGAPVPRDLLARMAEFLRLRGPDAQNLWCDLKVGFGHTLLDTSGVGAKDEQPCSIDGRVWIVADARVDARRELSEELRSSGITAPQGASDAELILLAYRAWGEDCLDHLLGDFAFAIWDGPCKQLFCARDQFGVKPFYYVDLPGCFVFSNTLNCLRLHPNVSSRLNDLAISDYLLFGSNQDPCTTSFEQIQRLAAGHSLLRSESTFRVSKYWTLQQKSEVHYQRRQDYVENFRALLRMAVQDRLRSDRVAVSMSGGLDSSTVAAVARRELGDNDQSRLHAYSVVYDKLIPDQERRFAGMVADFCGIPIHYLVADGYQLFGHWRNRGPGPAEPQDQALFDINRDLYAQIAVQSRVVLTGDGGDPCLLPSAAAVLELIRTGKVWAIASGYVRCARWQRSLPRAGLRTLIRARTNAGEESFIPRWINPELALKLDLSQRWRELQREPSPIKRHRPEAHKNLGHCGWANNFELYDPGNTSRPVEARHPFFDIRLVDFLLSLPTLPWCVGKQIIREAMIGFLPREVLRRRKAALAGDPVVELLKQPQTSWIDSFQPTPELLHYVTRPRIPPMAGKLNSSAETWSNLRPLSLDHWLRMQATVEYKGGRKSSHGPASHDKSLRSP